MQEKFVELNLTKTSFARMAQCGVILVEYAAEGYALSLWQLSDQLVARDHSTNTPTR